MHTTNRKKLKGKIEKYLAKEKNIFESHMPLRQSLHDNQAQPLFRIFPIEPDASARPDPSRKGLASV